MSHNSLHHINPLTYPQQLGYGLGTAMSKRGNKDALDEKIINDTLTAIKNGYYHLDGAECNTPCFLNHHPPD